MQITREADYAIRCVLHLAEAPGRVAMTGEIAAARLIPRPFLAKILQKLSRAGLVLSQRGVRGGFRLARRPGEITLLQVLEAMEGPLALNRCAEGGEGCHLQGACVVHPVWRELTGQVARTLARWDFSRFARSERRLREAAARARRGAEPPRRGTRGGKPIAPLPHL